MVEVIKEDSFAKSDIRLLMNDYCGFETLLEECKEYENDRNELLKKKTVKKNFEDKEM